MVGFMGLASGIKNLPWRGGRRAGKGRGKIPNGQNPLQVLYQPSGKCLSPRLATTNKARVVIPR